LKGNNVVVNKVVNRNKICVNAIKNLKFDGGEAFSETTTAFTCYD
jgi:hypothetical protein